VWLDFHSR